MCFQSDLTGNGKNVNKEFTSRRDADVFIELWQKFEYLNY